MTYPYEADIKLKIHANDILQAGLILANLLNVLSKQTTDLNGGVSVHHTVTEARLIRAKDEQ